MHTVAEPPAPDLPVVPTAPPDPAPAPPCAHCGAPLPAGQGWCLECGAGAPLGAGGHALWRPAATVLALTALLVIGTVAAAYAALNTPGRRSVTRPATVALASPAARPATATPATPAPPSVTAPTGTPPPAAKAAPLLPRKATAPPAATTAAPAPSAVRTPSTTSTTTTSTSTTTQPRPDPGAAAPAPRGTPVTIDPNAAGTYNPGAFPDGAFGDPSLTIDGDPTTAWTAQVQPRQAPVLGAGVVLDLNTRQRLSALTLITRSAGMSVGIYGANGSQPPAAITDPAWKLLSPVRRTKKTSHFTLATAGTRYRFVLVWITRVADAKASAADVSEISLTH